MKFVLPIILLFLSSHAIANIYTNNNFKPYIGIDFGVNIADYSYQTDLDNIYYSISANTGAIIGHNFGFELFFSQSSTNNLEHISETESHNHEFYYQAFGFDISAYCNISKAFEFLTSFGVANYKTYNKTEIIGYQTEAENYSENDITTRFGIGILYKFPGNHISGIFQYKYTPINNELINIMSEFSLGIRYTF